MGAAVRCGLMGTDHAAGTLAAKNIVRVGSQRPDVPGGSLPRVAGRSDKVVIAGVCCGFVREHGAAYQTW